MLAHIGIQEWAGFVVVVLGAIGSVLGVVLRTLRRLAVYETEHKALMADLKARTEHIERATPGIAPLPETAQVAAIVNGANGG